MRLNLVLSTAAILAAFSAVAAERSTVQQVPLTSKAGTGPATATLIEDGSRTRLAILLGRTPEGLANTNVIAEIREGSCGKTLGRALFTTVKTVNQDLTPGPETLGGNVPIRLSALDQKPHAIALRAGPEAGNEMIACGNIG